MQCFLLKKIAETQPEVFTPRSMKLFFDVHFMDFTANSQVLIFMDILSKSQPALFGPFIPHPLLNSKLMQDTMASYQMNIVTRAAAVCKDCQKPVFDYFTERLKSCTDQHVLYACIMGLREMLEICGPDFFTEEVQAVIENQKTSAPAKYIKDVAQNLQDELAGR
ncbi:uncharacterized protein LOC134255920, partial [Saccostrea cucullata]|uniref:uncharacterized protein LOC134255920 n=1 Tax=Saccostrea cuccullata TaxID=36930 RepID=UPI002ED63060